MTRIIFLVSRDHLDLVRGMTQEGRADNIEIIVDRRWQERRQTPEPASLPDCRHSQRRIRSTARELELIGIAVAVLP